MEENELMCSKCQHKVAENIQQPQLSRYKVDNIYFNQRRMHAPNYAFKWNSLSRNGLHNELSKIWRNVALGTVVLISLVTCCQATYTQATELVVQNLTVTCTGPGCSPTQDSISCSSSKTCTLSCPPDQRSEFPSVQVRLFSLLL